MAPRTSQREILNLTGFISKERFARFSENPDKFRDDFLRLGLAFSLTCLIIVILAHGCTRDEKESILTKAREPMASWPPIHTPNSSGRWGCNPRTWLTGTRGLCKARLGWDITYLSKGMKRHMVKPVNYDEVWEVTQEEGENPAVFLSWVKEAFRTCTNTDPESTKGGHYWPGILQLSYSRYLEKIAEAWGWAQTPLSALIEEAFKVCNNQDLMDNKDKRLMKHSFWLLWFTHHLKSTLGGWVGWTDHQGAAWAQIHCVSLSERGPLEGRMAWTPSCGMPEGQPWLAPVPCESPGWEILEHQLMGPKWCPAPDSTRSILIIPGELRVTLDVAGRRTEFPVDTDVPALFWLDQPAPSPSMDCTVAEVDSQPKGGRFTSLPCLRSWVHYYYSCLFVYARMPCPPPRERSVRN